MVKHCKVQLYADDTLIYVDVSSSSISDIESELSEYLKRVIEWRNDHIDYIGRKISVKLGILRKASKVIQRESCLTLFII